MTEEEYIKCSTCGCKYIDSYSHIKLDFGYDRLDNRYKTCKKCRDRRKNDKQGDCKYNKAYSLEKLKCDVCDCMVSRTNLSRHKQTNKCLTMESNKKEDIPESS